MKKLLIVLAIGAFAACNSSSTETTTEDTATVAPADSSMMMAPADSTMMAPDSTMTDTTAH